MAMLTINDLYVYYGVIQAIKGISFEVNEGEVIALIGANGAGKTTILHTITGLITARSGSIEFQGQKLTKLPPTKSSKWVLPMFLKAARIFLNLRYLKISSWAPIQGGQG